MINTIPPGDQKQIKIIGREQGYRGLAVHYGMTTNTPGGNPAPMLTTAYTPTPEELQRLNAGASIVVSLLTPQHPPIDVSVGEAPSLDIG